MAKEIFKLPTNSKISIGDERGLYEPDNLELRNIYQSLDIIIYNNKYRRQLITQQSNESITDFTSRLNSYDIKYIIDHCEYDRCIQWDKNEPVDILQEDGSYLRTYPNKTEKSTYLDYCKNQKINELNSAYNTKIQSYNLVITKDKLELDLSPTIEHYIDINNKKIIVSNIGYAFDIDTDFKTFVDSIDTQKETFLNQINSCTTSSEVMSIDKSTFIFV